MNRPGRSGGLIPYPSALSPPTMRSRSTRKSKPRPGRTGATPGNRRPARRTRTRRRTGGSSWAGAASRSPTKGLILSYGKKNGLPSKIVGWSPQQVAAAYRFARGRLQSTTR